MKATKKTVPITETHEYRQLRDVIQEEINSTPVNIDRSVFSKKPREVRHLKKMKRLWKQKAA